jgi:hypothetical protein
MKAADWIALGAVFATLLTPIAIVVLGFTFNKRFKNFERTLEEQRRVSETRFQLYQDIGFKLNDLYAYFLYVGNWKENDPRKIVEYKRELDRHVFTYRPIFSNDFNKKYDGFILSCFKTFGGWKKDARLRTTSKHRLEEGQPEWSEWFTEEDNRQAIRESYRSLLDCLASDLGVADRKLNH